MPAKKTVITVCGNNKRHALQSEYGHYNNKKSTHSEEHAFRMSGLPLLLFNEKTLADWNLSPVCFF